MAYSVVFKRPIFSFKKQVVVFLIITAFFQYKLGERVDSDVLDRWETNGDVYIMSAKGEVLKKLDVSFEFNVYPDSYGWFEQQSYNDPQSVPRHIALTASGDSVEKLKEFDLGAREVNWNRTWSHCELPGNDSYVTYSVSDISREVKKMYWATVKLYDPGYKERNPYYYGILDAYHADVTHAYGIACSEVTLVNYNSHSALFMSKNQRGTYLVASMERKSRHSFIYRIMNSITYF